MEAPAKSARELVQRARTGLSRYGFEGEDLVEVSGRLENVETTGEDDAWLAVRPIDGLAPGDLASAVVPSPTPEIDRLLEDIGRNGRITLIGSASVSGQRMDLIRMTQVDFVNGTSLRKLREHPSRR